MSTITAQQPITLGTAIRLARTHTCAEVHAASASTLLAIWRLGHLHFLAHCLPPPGAQILAIAWRGLSGRERLLHYSSAAAATPGPARAQLAYAMHLAALLLEAASLTDGPGVRVRRQLIAFVVGGTARPRLVIVEQQPRPSRILYDLEATP